MILKEFIEKLQQYDENLIVTHSEGGNIVLKEGILTNDYFRTRDRKMSMLLDSINHTKKNIEFYTKEILNDERNIKYTISNNKNNEGEVCLSQDIDNLKYDLTRHQSKLKENEEDLVRLQKELDEFPVSNNAICIDTDEEDCDDDGSCGCGCED